MCGDHAFSPSTAQSRLTMGQQQLLNTIKDLADQFAYVASVWSILTVAGRAAAISTIDQASWPDQAARGRLSGTPTGGIFFDVNGPHSMLVLPHQAAAATVQQVAAFAIEARALYIDTAAQLNAPLNLH